MQVRAGKGETVCYSLGNCRVWGEAIRHFGGCFEEPRHVATHALNWVMQFTGGGVAIRARLLYYANKCGGSRRLCRAYRFDDNETSGPLVARLRPEQNESGGMVAACVRECAVGAPHERSERREATEHNTPHKEQSPTTATGGTTACIVGGHTQQSVFA